MLKVSNKKLLQFFDGKQVHTNTIIKKIKLLRKHQTLYHGLLELV